MSKERIEARIATARARLASNLSELQQRATRAKEAVSPGTYLGSPWLKVGIGVAIGLFAGRRSRRAHLQLTAGDGAPVAQPSMARSLARAAIGAAMSSLVGAFVEKTVADLTRRAEDATPSE